MKNNSQAFLAILCLLFIFFLIIVGIVTTNIFVFILGIVLSGVEIIYARTEYPSFENIDI